MFLSKAQFLNFTQKIKLYYSETEKSQNNFFTRSCIYIDNNNFSVFIHNILDCPALQLPLKVRG